MDGAGLPAFSRRPRLRTSSVGSSDAASETVADMWAERWQQGGGSRGTNGACEVQLPDDEAKLMPGSERSPILSILL